jgi:hypothetical protein
MDQSTCSTCGNGPLREPTLSLCTKMDIFIKVTSMPVSGIVELLRRRRASGIRVPLFGPPHHLGGSLRTRNLGPTLEPISHFFAVRRRGQQVPPGSEMLGNGAVRRQKALGSVIQVMLGPYTPWYCW